jgi:hypothetical protein
VNPAAEGTVYPAATLVIDPDRLAAFRALFDLPEGVPPTFLTALEFAVFPQILDDPALDLDFSRVLHGSQDYEYVRSLVEGETLSVRAWIDSIRVRGGTGFLTVVMEYSDEAGAVVATSRSTLIEQAAA